MLQVEVPADKLGEMRQRLASHPMVAAAGLNYVYSQAKTFNDPALANSSREGWALRRIRAPEAWDVTTGSVTIAIVDSGSKVDHEELAGKVVAPYSYATRSATMQEAEFSGQGGKQFLLGHGTHVAVTAGGTAGNGVGTAGVAPTSPIMPIQVFGYDATQKKLKTDSTFILAAIGRAMGAGARVINLSLGIDDTQTPEGQKLIADYNAADPARKRQMEQEMVSSPDFNTELNSYRGL